VVLQNRATTSVSLKLLPLFLRLKKIKFFSVFCCPTGISCACDSWLMFVNVCRHQHEEANQIDTCGRNGSWICLPPYFSGPGIPGSFFLI
jgi:hypothetical protein